MVGYGIAVMAQVLVFPWFGLHVTLAENMTMGALFTVVSIVRSYSLRRVFEAFKVRRVAGASVPGSRATQASRRPKQP